MTKADGDGCAAGGAGQLEPGAVGLAAAMDEDKAAEAEQRAGKQVYLVVVLEVCNPGLSGPSRLAVQHVLVRVCSDPEFAVTWTDLLCWCQLHRRLTAGFVVHELITPIFIYIHI